MFFGQYLLKEKVINGEQLVQAIAHQQESMPSLFRVLFENKILATEQLVDTITKLVSQKKDLVSLAIEENLVSKEDLVKAQLIQSKNGLTLGQALVDLEFLAVTDLEHHLTNYLTLKNDDNNSDDQKVTKEDESSSEPKLNDSGISAAALESLKELGEIDDNALAELVGGGAEIAPTASVEKPDSDSGNSGEPAISAAALESLKELGEIGDNELAELVGGSEPSLLTDNAPKAVDDLHDNTNRDYSEYEKEFSLVEKMNDNFVEEFLGTYNEKTYKKLNKIAKFIKDTAESGGDIANFFNSLYRDVHVVKGASTLVESRLCEKIWSLWENIVEGLFAKDNDQLKVWVDTYLRDMKISFELLWEVRNEIEKSKNESALWNDHEWKEKYLDNYRIVKEIAKIISS